MYKGYIKTAVGKDLVAIKTGNGMLNIFLDINVNKHFVLLALFSHDDLEILAKEVSTMLSFKHEHVMSLIGVCIDGEMPLLIMPFMSNGSVLDYVRSCKDRLVIMGECLKEEVTLNS